MSDAIILTNSELKELTQRAMGRTGRAEDARRARLILLLAEGHTWDEVSEHIDCSRGFVASCRATHCGTLQSAFGASGHRAHPETGSTDSGGNTTCTPGWCHPLEHAQTRSAFGCQPHDGGES